MHVARSVHAYHTEIGSTRPVVPVDRNSRRIENAFQHTILHKRQTASSQKALVDYTLTRYLEPLTGRAARTEHCSAATLRRPSRKHLRWHLMVALVLTLQILQRHARTVTSIRRYRFTPMSRLGNNAPEVSGPLLDTGL